MTTATSVDLLKLKHVATINDEALGEDTDPGHEIQYVDISNVDSSGRIGNIASYTFDAAPSRARRRVRDGDVIISMVRTYLQAIALVRDPPENLLASTGFAVVRPRPERLATEYCKYALREPSFLAEVEMRSVGVGYPAITALNLANIRIPVPPIPHQHAIADYLDRETAKLDALVAAKERVLRLLGDKRRVLITRAVTRGIDPDVSLRDSGLPWLGEIPAHWETWKLGHLGTVGNGSTPNRGNARYWIGGTIPWLNSGVVNQAEVISSDEHVSETALDECHLPVLQPGTVLVAITGQGKTRGRAVVLSTLATINQHLAFVDPDRERLHPWFLRWWLFAAYDFLRSISDDAGGTKGALTCEDVASLRIAFPPVEDQVAIVEHIACELEKLRDAGEATRRAIDLLKERRGALIAGAVTGQIDVEAAA